MGRLNQFKALMWKSLKIRYRYKLSSVFEIGVAVAIGLLLIGLRSIFGKDIAPTEIFSPKALEQLPSYYVPFVPKSPATNELMSYVIEINDKLYVRGYDTVDASYVDILKNTSNQLPLAPTILFDNVTPKTTVLPKQLSVRLLVAFTIQGEDNLFIHETEHFEDIYQNDSANLRASVWVKEAFINYWCVREAKQTVSLNMSIQKMPQFTFGVDASSTAYEDFGPFLLVTAFVITATSLAKFITIEKELKLKESMKLMGIYMSIYWMHWFATGLMLYTIVIVILTYFSLYETDNGPPIASATSVIIVLFYYLFAIDTISFSVLVTCFSKKASMVGTILNVAVYGMVHVTPIMLKQLSHFKATSLGLGVILYEVGFLISAQAIFRRPPDDGYTFFNIHMIPAPGATFSLLEGLLLMVANSVFNIICIWYIDSIFPGEYGIPQPYNFCIKPSYWFPGVASVDEDIAAELPQQSERYFEKASDNLKTGVEVRGLVKVFGRNIAVAGTNLNLYEGQTTVLLGHNGAGKTTTIAMITGFLPPTRGTVIVNGYDITKDTTKARESLGLCPQYDILFDRLTCYEHIKFFSMLKGSDRRDEVASTLLSSVGLDQKKDTFACRLSVGQKRKLSVACAVLGDTKVIILDEPSSGMDPTARREMWTFLKNIRQGRTLLLTTHYMDEAEALGDRIAIMAEGVVKCCGTAMFLKQVYAAGYQLSIVRKPDCSTETVTASVLSRIPDIKFVSSTNEEIYYLIPNDSLKRVPALCRMLEEHGKDLHISSFGISATSLEDVFIKVGKNYVPKLAKLMEAKDNEDDNDNSASDSLEGDELLDNQEDEDSDESLTDQNASCMRAKAFFDFNASYGSNQGCARFTQQMKAIFIKKAILTKRNWFSFVITSFIIPTGCLLAGLYADKTARKQTEQPPFWYSLKPFKETTVSIWTGENITKNLVDAYEKSVPLSSTIEFVTYNENISDHYLQEGDKIGRVKYQMKYVVGVNFVDETRAIALYQQAAYHGAAVSVNVLLDAYINYFLGHDYSVKTAIENIARTSKVAASRQMGIVTMMTLSLAMALLPARLISELIEERQTGARHLQVVSGVNPLAYWLPTFYFDYLTYTLTIGVLMATFLYEPSVYLGHGRWLVTATILIAYGFAMYPNAYLLQLLFTTPASGSSTIVTYEIIIGTMGAMVMEFLTKVHEHIALDILDTTFALLCPTYDLSQSMVRFNLISESLGDEVDYALYFGNHKLSLKRNICILIIQFWVYFTVIFLNDFGVLRLLWYTFGSKDNKVSENYEYWDSDVKIENLRIRRTPIETLIKTDQVILKNLYKNYNGMIAVDSLSMGMSKQECFGLLGQNGAGKSTTFKMITGDIMLTGGDVILSGNSIRTNPKKVHAQMGYTPQVDGLHARLTGRETLYLHGRLRGVPERHLYPVSSALIELLTLSPHADKLTCQYSGGNKRKLSTGIALIGNPSFLMLDEPTSGMDPVARRALWNVLKQVRASGKTMVLTSHSMEECEALCTRIGIMVAGGFMCLGSPQHLKNKFAQGYTIIVRLRHDDSAEGLKRQKEMVVHMKNQLKGAEVFEEQQNYVHFQVPQRNLRMSRVFEIMERTKMLFEAEDYIVQQTSLEQVFLFFVRATDIINRGPKHYLQTLIECCA